MRALDHLWDQLSTAKWVADTGLPLVFTLLGLVVAVWLVKRQLTEDRRLRTADRAERGVAPLAIQLRESADHLRTTEADSTFWTSTDWPDAGPVLRALRESTAYLARPARDQITRLAARTAREWALLSSERTRRSETSLTTADFDHGMAMQNALSPYATLMQRVAENLERWDGLAELRPVATSHARALDAPPGEAIAEYRAQLDDIGGM